MDSQIRYKIIGGLKFYERREVKDVLGYLKLLANPRDLVAAQRTINTPIRGIGPVTQEAFFSWVRECSRQAEKTQHIAPTLYVFSFLARVYTSVNIVFIELIVMFIYLAESDWIICTLLFCYRMMTMTKWMMLHSMWSII
jgi:hypothetical protein